MLSFLQEHDHIDGLFILTKVVFKKLSGIIISH